MTDNGGDVTPTGELKVKKVPSSGPAAWPGDPDPAKRTGEAGEIPPPDPS